MSATTVAQPHEHARTASTYRHEALLWDHLDAFLALAVPFVQEAVTAGQPVLLALTDTLWLPLREELGTAADLTLHVDMTELGGNPGRIIPAWLDFVRRHGTPGVELRGIGEPIWVGRRPVEVSEGQLHEALLNAALTPSTPLWLLCPYDASRLDPEVLAEARRSHPTVGDGVEATASSVYAGETHPWTLSEQPLPPPRGPVEHTTFHHGGLAEIRRMVARHATSAGLEGRRIEDLVLAVNELAANSVDHGPGHGEVLAWREDGALMIEVRDTGRLASLLAGRVTPEPGQLRGRGLWLVHHLSDLVQIRTGPGGTAVRVHSWL
ncbi:sensor histidine kinase [Actinotalea sp. BY-33]|uniref:Sensor histidine kinase n=1 Tax=Actinotalea soli TaxID=2819234 RepID=A0A939LSC7_9CELL|nr:sensor histidine kinase [Actinotalea soli]MBO1753208.1 sensor histidine kinase [Actinotalea soli]